jgi:hypothetical protein
VAVARGGAARAARAARLLGAAAADRDRTGHPADAVEREDVDRAGSAARAVLGEQAFAEAVADGRRTGPGPLTCGD